MAANDDRALSEILNRTIEYDPKTNVASMHSLIARSKLFPRKPNCEKNERGVVKTCTGSAAELRIKPLLTCIGDVDIMFHYTDEIALPWNCLNLPTRKMKGMHSTLQLFLMVPLPDYPGYANMLGGGSLSWNTQMNSYHLVNQEKVVSALSNHG